MDGIQGPPLYQIGFFLSDPPKKGRVGHWFVRWRERYSTG